MWVIRQVLLASAEERMVLAKDVVDHHGRILLKQGTMLKHETMRQLDNFQVVSVWVETTDVDNYEMSIVQELVSAAARMKLANTIESAFYSRDGIAAHLPQLQDQVSNIAADIIKRKDALIYIADIGYKCDYLFLHSVNVGLFSMVLGVAMKLPFEEICQLGMGGFLHDFGKTRIAKEILDKQGPLSLEEFHTVKEHASFGYNILKAEAEIDHRIMLMALQHHERPDGKGYPWGLTDNKIHPLAKIVAVADVYDALTTDRVYRTRLNPHEALKNVEAGIGCQFDSAVVHALQNVAIPYNIGTAVKLSSGENGKVIRLNSANLARPIVATASGLLNLLFLTEISVLGFL